MVITVQTRNPGIPRHHSCTFFGDDDDGDDGTAPLRSASAVEYSEGGVGAEILAAVLQTAWGIAPTHLSWSTLHDRTRADFLWS
eukprot:COSAG05_NODE_24208_length_253_cov_0.662338_1_plen_83_part_11